MQKEYISQNKFYKGDVNMAKYKGVIEVVQRFEVEVDADTLEEARGLMEQGEYEVIQEVDIPESHVVSMDDEN